MGATDDEPRRPHGGDQPLLGSRAPGRSHMVSISDHPDEEGFFEEARTMDISVRSTDFGSQPTQPGRADRAVLLRMDGVSAGQVMGITQTPFSIGRHPTNQLKVDDDSMSRFHARFVRESDGFYVEDLESRNGTFVQGKRVLRCKLNDDDWVQFGSRVAFRFSMTDARQEGLMRRLFESSTRDALTGAYNRMHFEDRLRAEVAFGARHNTDCAIVLLDLDHFKRVNDSLGHQAGDEVLRHLAALATRTLRAEDIFARFGGEEFVILLRGSSTKGAGRLAERLRDSLATTPASFDGASIPVTLSAGCAALSCCQSPTPNELVATADRRLYRAKADGRNRVVAAD
ncbi:MAG TPA: GGDEF domain-containing protein [Polyangiaceae bacterium]